VANQEPDAIGGGSDGGATDLAGADGDAPGGALVDGQEQLDADELAKLESRWRDLGDFIREQRRVGQLSLRRLSEMAGVSNPYLSQIERGLRKPSADILRQIARALSISSEELYVRAGILEERPGQADLVVEIRRAGDITEDQKKTLIHIYESFRSENASPPPGAAGNGDAPGAS
jgi:transcriptional regulator with XRE-family HTH domain